MILYESRAHAYLLSLFSKPYDSSKILNNRGWCYKWRKALRASPKKAIKWLYQEGYIIDAPLEDRLDAVFRLVDLKEIAKEHKLPVSGRKSVVIQRLVDADRLKMESKVSGIKGIYICSEKGRVIADQFKSLRDEEKRNCEVEMLKLLNQRQFKEATKAFIQYQNKQVFPTGINNSNARNYYSLLDFIFNSEPAFIKDLDSWSKEILRVICAMNSFWMTKIPDRWLPENFTWSYKFDLEKCCQMMNQYSFIQFKIERIKSMRDLFDKVQIRCSDDVCNNCKKNKNKIFNIEDMPELPNPDCTHELGCRCMIYPYSSKYSVR